MTLSEQSVSARGTRRESGAPATFVPLSRNAKTGPVAATYASIRSTCPDSCAFKDAGCYAQGGRVAITVRRLDSAGATAIEAAHTEARLVETGQCIPGLPLRLHVSGDARLTYSAQRLGLSASRWRARSGGPVWTYTHAFRDVPRGAWGPDVSVLASCDHPSQAPLARSQGYAPAVVVAELPPDGRAWYDRGSATRWIPCPEQTRGITCTQCRLCFNADSLRDRGAGIAFGAHGQGAKHVKLRLQVVS